MPKGNWDPIELDIEGALTAAGYAILDYALDEVPVDHGALRRSHHVSEPERSAGIVSVTVGVDPAQLPGTVNYAPFVHFGTGIHGIRGKRIRPRKAKALRIPGIGYRKSVAGQRKNPWMDRALEKGADPAIEAFVKHIVRR